MPKTGGRNRGPTYPKDIVQHVAVPGKTGPGRGGVMGTPPPDQRGDAQQTLTAFLSLPPAQFVPPPGAIDFSASDEAILGPAATGTVASFQLPVGRIGVIRSVLFQITDILVTTDASFTVRLNQGPVPGWRYNIFPKAASFDSISFGPDETFILTPSGALVDMQITIADAGTYNTGAQFHGWHISKRTALKYGLGGVV